MPAEIHKQTVMNKGAKAKIKKIKGHSGIPENNKADKLARENALGERILVPK